MAEAGGHAPHPAVAGRSVFETVPACLSGSASNKDGGSPRCRPVLCGLRDRCIAAMLATRKAEVSGHAPQPRDRGPSGFQPEAARLSALTSKKWSLRLDSHQHLTAYETAALLYATEPKTRSASRICAGLSPLPTGCVAFYALADFEMVGHLGAAPSVSPIRTARIAVFLVPDEMDAHPGLAPGSSVLQTDGSTTLLCARLRMGSPTGAAPAQRSSQDRMPAVTSRPPFEKRSSGRRCPGMVSFTRGVHC